MVWKPFYNHLNNNNNNHALKILKQVWNHINTLKEKITLKEILANT